MLCGLAVIFQPCFDGGRVENMAGGLASPGRCTWHFVLGQCRSGVTRNLCIPLQVQLLAALPKVPRFDLAVMSLGASSRALLAHVWDDKVTALKDKALVRHLAQVKPKYRL